MNERSTAFVTYLASVVALVVCLGLGLGWPAARAYGGRADDGFVPTGRELDVALDGPGYFQVVHPSGEIQYTRCGRLYANGNNQLVVGSPDSELMIEPAISVPSDAKRVMIGPDGLVLMERAGSKKLEAWGKFQLASFARPDALRPCGEHVFAMTEASGPPDTFEASPDRVTVMQRMLDARFVDARR